MNIDSRHITNLLRQRHADDLFVAECKAGRTDRRMDGWAMTKSWVNAMYIGYEIKVSRSDFLRDNKWIKYLPYCTSFYFVCPWGMIDKSEIGEMAGLIYVTNNGNRLLVKKKSPALKDQPLQRERLMKAILMNRVEIVDSTFGRKKEMSNLEYWEKWLRNKEHRSIIGRSVSIELCRAVRYRIDKTEKENEHLEKENKRLSEVKELLEQMGISLVNPYQIESKIRGRLLPHFEQLQMFATRAADDLGILSSLIREEIKKAHAERE